MKLFSKLFLSTSLSIKKGYSIFLPPKKSLKPYSIQLLLHTQNYLSFFPVGCSTLIDFRPVYFLERKKVALHNRLVPVFPTMRRVTRRCITIQL